jgi:GntR family transcriptional regulator, transcriptional repressor for pyruvate dehydrogenase complex
MPAPLTEAAIEKLRAMIMSGELSPGSRLPPEAKLAEILGMSRGPVREAVRALVTARVLDVRRGDGTYITSLSPELLLEGIGFAVDLMQDESALELLEVRRVLEPAATELAAIRATDAQLAEIGACLDWMRAAKTGEELVKHDAEFHSLVGAASGNRPLASMLSGVSGRSLRARIWRGMIEADATSRTIAEHQQIYEALSSRDGARSAAAALVHVATTASWLRRLLSSDAESNSALDMRVDALSPAESGKSDTSHEPALGDKECDNNRYRGQR